MSFDNDRTLNGIDNQNRHLNTPPLECQPELLIDRGDKRRRITGDVGKRVFDVEAAGKPRPVDNWLIESVLKTNREILHRDR